jgi:amino acid adenylation domain-containing protein
MGAFFNTVAVRGDKIEPSKRVTDYISAMHTAASGAFAHQEIPFEHLVKKLKLGVPPNRTPVFSALFNMYGIQYQSERDGLAIEPFDRSAIGGQNVNSKFDITLLAIEHEDGLQIDFSFKADLYRAETARWLVAQFKALTAAVIKQPEQLISELPALSPIPHIHKSDEDDAWQTGYIRVPLKDTQQSIVQCFDRQAALFPEKNAMEMDGEKLTYRELQNVSVNLRDFIMDHVNTLPRLSRKEQRRYSRQNTLDGWGVETQEKLKGLTVFAAGAGGSGSPVIMQLALMGVGTIIICDFDTIEETNLNRQFLHDEDRIGMNKAQSAALSVKRLNSHVNVIVREEKIDRDNVDCIASDSAIIFDNVDSLEAKFILSECAVRKGIPHVIASNIERSAYAAIFHTPHTPCFHCCYDKNILKVEREFREEMGGWERTGNPVVSPPLFLSTGFAVGEAIKIVLGFENPAYNKFFFFNSQSSSMFSQTSGFKRITYPFSRHFIETGRRYGFDWEKGFSGKFGEEIPIERDPDCVLCGSAPVADVSVVQPKRFGCDDPDVGVILMNQGIGAAAAVMGILRSGYAFAFISPDYPAERLEYILKDTGAHLIVTDDANEEIAYGLRDKINRNIVVLNIGRISTDAPKALQTQTPYGPDQLAYIVYTSGSTGTPKGVMQTHRNVLHYTRNYVNGLRIGSGDRLSLIPSLAFSAAMVDIFTAFSTGATLCLYDIKKGDFSLGTWLLENRISVYHSVPTVFRRFADSLEPGENLPDLRVIDLGGEPVTRVEIGLFHGRFHSGCTFVNGFGATELNVVAQHKIKSGETVDGNVPVGYPTEDTEILLLGPDSNPVSYNQPGELVIKSPYLSPGYWNMKEETDASFGQEAGTDKRLFYMGDIALLRPDGRLEHLGRRDLQLKIRGIRIELLEIETVLKTLPMILDAVVCAQENKRGEKYIVAYFVCRENQPVGSDYITSHLRQTLPEYMIPSAYTRLDTLPLTTTGKIDRRRLGNSGGVQFETASLYAPPTNDTEKKLSELWQKALNAEKVGIHDNFFDLGGNSLDVIDLVNGIKTEMGGSLSILDILKHPTIAQMSHCIKPISDQNGL